MVRYMTIVTVGWYSLSCAAFSPSLKGEEEDDDVDKGVFVTRAGALIDVLVLSAVVGTSRSYGVVVVIQGGGECP